MEARDYQTRCCEAILSAVDAGHKAILCDLFTGAGKTFLFALLARMEWNCKFLVLAHQRELVWQAADMADKVLGETAEVEMGELWAQDYGNSMTVACTATLQRGRYRRFLGVDFIIVDEAHRQMSPPFLAMLQEFQAAGGVVIGFTATPFRMDRKKLMDFYTSHCFSMGFQAGIDEGWCVPPRAKIVRCKHLDLRHVAVSGGDYSAADLDLILGCSKPLHEMCLIVQKERLGPAIAFLPGVKSAMELAAMASSQYGIKAEFVCGNTNLQSEDDRNAVLSRFRKGEVELLCNCQIAVMGFDAPVTQAIFMFRPTRSRSLALQIWGRAMRPLPGIVDGLAGAAERVEAIAGSTKSHFRVIDITDCLADHSLVTAVDMFAADDTPAEVVKRARAAAEEGDAQDPADLLAQAAEDVRKAQLLEQGLALLHGRASGDLHEQEVQLAGKKKCISEYRVPLRGKYAGKTMGAISDEYLNWALGNPSIRGWQRTYFARERARRRAAVQHAG
jgi:superfamily II DNA or RNA helicase